jgi:hypothetical protein
MTNVNNSKFWMVLRSSSIAVTAINPTLALCPYNTKQGAIDEAESLAAKYPGNRYYVLEAVMFREVRGMIQVDLVD